MIHTTILGVPKVTHCPPNSEMSWDCGKWQNTCSMNSRRISFNEKCLSPSRLGGPVRKKDFKISNGKICLVNCDAYLKTSLQNYEFDISSFVLYRLLKEIFEYKIYVIKL